MKTIFVRVNTIKEAIERSTMPYKILRDCTPVIADLRRKDNAVQTECVCVRYMTAKNLDGLRCDIPCGFGSHGKVMATSKKYKELSDEWEIADFIEKEEQANE